jgi:gamma-D-glutamyl-L-lysine dipeptidyl-peptidase
MDYAIVSVPAAPVRRKPRHQSEMVNQLLFGEEVKIIKEKTRGWVKIRSLLDNYEGWMVSSLLQQTDAKMIRQENEYLVAGLFNTIRLNENVLQVPFASSLPGFGIEGQMPPWIYEFDGKYIKKNEQQPGPWLVRQLAVSWLNAPYLWGGRTIFGVDCSGFVQVIYKMMGMDLPRDAWQQAQEGKTIKKLKDAVCGDLAFFDDREEIVHVGILLSNEQIIHASGKVRIDRIDKKGIVNSDTGDRTHSLRAIKRRW